MYELKVGGKVEVTMLVVGGQFDVVYFIGYCGIMGDTFYGF